MAKRVAVCLTFDYDAMSVWIGNLGLKSQISRGEFGAIGAQRLLAMLEEWRIKATWFVPGHTADSLPKSVEQIAAAGHEIGHHGYLHQAHQTAEEEVRDFERALAALQRVTRQTPVGYRAPAGVLRPWTIELLTRRGFLYDSSLMGNDFTPYYCRIGDQAPSDGPFVFGAEVDLVELPMSWGLDDFVAFEHVWTRNGVLPGLADPSRVFEIWAGDFDYLYDRLGAGIYVLTMHPQCIGRGHRLLMLEKLVNHIRAQEGVSFMTMAEVAAQWRTNNPVGGVAHR